LRVGITGAGASAALGGSATTTWLAAEASVASFQTAIWLDTISAINGGGTTGRTGLMQQLTNAAAQGTATTPALVEIVIYDLPGRDCAALASNGEIPATAAGLTEYETQYINPIATILNQFASKDMPGRQQEIQAAVNQILVAVSGQAAS